MFGIGLGKLGSVSATTPTQRAIAVLRKFGSDAHVYLPGVGMLNGLQAGNFIHSNGTEPGEVDQPVGLVLDAAGGLGVELYSFANVSAAGALTSVTSGFTFDGSGQLAGDAGQRSSVNFPTVIGLTYKFVLRINSGPMTSPGAGFFIRAGVNGMGTILHSVSAPVQKIHEAVLVAQSTTTSILFDSAIDFSIYTIDNISAREVTGIHAQQPTTSAKPILRRDAGGRYYWKFDGSNDSLSLGGPLFQMADDHCVVAGFTCSNDAAARVVASNYGNATSAFAAQIYQLSNTVIVEWRDDTGVTCSPAAQTAPLGSAVVISGRRVGNTSTSRKNAGNPLTATAVLGVSTINTAAIGSNRFGNFFNGSIYPVITIKGTVSDSDLLLLEKWVGSMSGVTI